MDLSEYYALYHQSLETDFTKLDRSCRLLRDAPQDKTLLASALRAAHSIKGATWTIRETPSILNDDPPDIRFDQIGKLAEQLEAHLEYVLQGHLQLDYALLQNGVTSLETSIRQRQVD